MGCLNNPDFKSSTLLNAIKTGASQAYKDIVPDATANNLAEVGTAILNWSATRNEFVNALFNRIGKVVISDKMYENPLRELKKGNFSMGKTIEEVFVDLVQEHAYNPNVAEQELYKRNLPDIKSVFHEINRKGFFKTTVEEDLLSMAFVGEDGMSNLIEKIISKLYDSDEYNEFLYMKNIVYQYGVEGMFSLVEITNPTDEASAKVAMTKIKEISNDMTFMKTPYNFAGVKTHTRKEDQILLVNTAFDALIDVEVLASAFNMDKADFSGRKVLVDDFGGLANVVAALVDRDWFMVYDKLLRTEDKFNEQGLYYNYWLHHWQVLSASRFHNAVLFVTTVPELTSIELSPATADVYKGCAQQFVVEATGTNNPPKKCTFELTGANSSYTYINSLGLLIVGEDETATSITVTATSTFNNLISDTAVVTVL